MQFLAHEAQIQQECRPEGQGHAGHKEKGEKIGDGKRARGTKAGMETAAAEEFKVDYTVDEDVGEFWAPQCLERWLGV